MLCGIKVGRMTPILEGGMLDSFSPVLYTDPSWRTLLKIPHIDIKSKQHIWKLDTPLANRLDEMSQVLGEEKALKNFKSYFILLL